MANTPTYRCIMTDAGAALEVQAKLTGKAVLLTHLAIGDGKGNVPDPDPAVTALSSEVCRRRIDATFQDKDNPCILWTETVLPADIGGWWIREVGLYAETDAGPVLFAYGNHAPYHKTLSRDGQATEHTIKVPIIVSSDAVVTVNVSTSGLATRDDLRVMQGHFAELLRQHQKMVNWMGDLEAEVHKDKPVEDQRANGMFVELLAQNQKMTNWVGSLATGADVVIGVSPPMQPGGEAISPGVTLSPLTVVESGSTVPTGAKVALVEV